MSPQRERTSPDGAPERPLGGCATDTGAATRRGVLEGVASAGAAVAAGPAAARTAGSGRDQTADGGDAEDESVEDLSALVDDAVETALEDRDVAGAAVSVVRDGEIALTEGYGHALLDDATPVDPDATPFHLGSTSKVLTWTAAMQLVDRGAVDPHVDVNEYLESLAVPETYDDPVTLATLATHTSGFQMRIRGDRIDDPAQRRPLATSVAEDRPPRVQPPGELPLYTNYAAALTGVLIEDVTDESFDSYLQSELFDPLGMTDAGTEVVPPGIAGSPEAFVDALSFHSDVPPAVGIHATASDVAKLLLAHLEGESAEGEPVLSRAAREEMHRQWYTADDAIDGMAFGFLEDVRNGSRVLSHTGSHAPYFTELFLVPEQGVGVFVAAAGDDAGGASSDVAEQLREAFVPADPTPPPAPDGPPARADEIEGTYRTSLVDHSETAEKAIRQLSFTADHTVDVDADGALVTERGDRTDRWVEVEPLVFRHVDGDDALVFLQRDGEVDALVYGGGTTSYHPVGPHDDASLQAGVAAVAAFVLLASVLARAAGAGLRCLRGRALPGHRSSGARLATAVAAGWPFATVVALAVGAAVHARLGGPPMLFRPSAAVLAPLVVPLVGLAATLVAGAYVVTAWHGARWPRSTRLHYTAVVVASLALCWLAQYWRVLGPQL